MWEIIYSDKRSMRLRQFLFSAEDINAGELMALCEKTPLHSLDEYYGGKYYIARVKNPTCDTNDPDGIRHIKGYKPLYLTNRPGTRITTILRIINKC